MPAPDKHLDFKFPVTWEQMFEPIAALVPADKREAVYAIVGALQQRDQALEDFLSFQLEIITFDHRDAVTATTSDPAPVHRGGRVNAIGVTADATASSDTTLKLYKNGVQIGADFVLPSGEPATDGVYRVDVADFRYEYVERGSALKLESATVGSGLEGLVVDVVLRG